MNLKMKFSKVVWITSYFFVYIFRFNKRLNLDPSIFEISGPIIVISNHRNILDPWIIFSSFPFTIFLKILPIKIYAATKFSNSKISVFLAKFNLIKVIYWLYDCIEIPEGSLENKLLPIYDALYLKKSILFFPEGGLKKGLYTENLKPGIIYVLKKFPEIPLVFVGVKYSRRRFLPTRQVTVSLKKVILDKSDISIEAIQSNINHQIKLCQ